MMPVCPDCGSGCDWFVGGRCHSCGYIGPPLTATNELKIKKTTRDRKVDPRHCGAGRKIGRNYPEGYFG